MTGDSPSPPLHYVIHGHFYQPPREDAWLDLIERQPAAKPYHDWNERIYDECYRPNSSSRILDAHGMIKGMHNNYRLMSFNFGPTLFRWLEKEHPRTAEMIVEADRDSCQRLSGHGNALAQVYNHLIMPLASRRDQLTQIRWAKAFFKSRFGRETEGIWLAETAINMETVTCLIEEGIRFTVLSPHQAEAFRALDHAKGWVRIEDQPIDTRRAYRIFARDPDGRERGGHLDVFFFDEPLSRAISFGDVLTSSERLAAEIRSRFSSPKIDGEAIVVATDGETFGHHKPFGDMCLAFLFSKIGPDSGLLPVNFGYLLERYPPRFEIRLKNGHGEGTAWSCAHGVGRWVRDCGCQTGGAEGWKQTWRAPLRSALETLQKRIDTAFENGLADLVTDPWALRDSYAEFMDTPSSTDMKRALERGGLKRPGTPSEILCARRLLESQKFMLFAFTSCGWFFSDICGIETVQNLSYAGRALQLALEPSHQDEALRVLLDDLAKAVSNLAGKTGRTLFETRVMPMADHLKRLAFTAAAERTVLGERNARPDYFGYAITMERTARRIGAPRENIVYRASIHNESTAEQATYWILVTHRRGADIQGHVLPAHSTRPPEFDIRDPAAWAAQAQGTVYNLSSLYEESKEAFVAAYRGRIMQNTPLDYGSWLEENGKALQSLAELKRPLDLAIAGFIQHVLSARWNRLVARLATGNDMDGVFAELLEIWDISKKLSLEVGLDETARVLESLLAAKVKLLQKSIDLSVCDEISMLLNIVDRFSISVGKNRLEDAFYSVLNSSVRRLYQEHLQSPQPHEELESALLHVLSFARRMNFSTDIFPLS